MLALLTELDPAPLAKLLELPTTDIFMEREYQLSASKRGRIDMAVFASSSAVPLAVLEAKVSDSIRDGQLEKYEPWVCAREIKHETRIGRYLIDLNGTNHSPLENWQVLNQAELIGAWRTSENPHCVWLSQLLYESLDEVDTQAEAFIGQSSAWSVHDVITRRLENDLGTELAENAPDYWEVFADRDNGGNPMLTIRLRHPELPKVWLLLDLRSPGRRSTGTPWSLRVMMRTFADEFHSTVEAQRQCFSAAMHSLELLSLDSLAPLLEASPNPSHHSALSTSSQGFRKPLLSATQVRAELLGDATADVDPSNPIPAAASKYLYQDRQLRFGAKYELNLNEMTRHDLKDLLLLLIEHLYQGSKIPSEAH